MVPGIWCCAVRDANRSIQQRWLWTDSESVRLCRVGFLSSASLPWMCLHGKSSSQLLQRKLGVSLKSRKLYCAEVSRSTRRKVPSTFNVSSLARRAELARCTGRIHIRYPTGIDRRSSFFSSCSFHYAAEGFCLLGPERSGS